MRIMIKKMAMRMEARKVGKKMAMVRMATKTAIGMKNRMKRTEKKTGNTVICRK